MEESRESLQQPYTPNTALLAVCRLTSLLVLSGRCRQLEFKDAYNRFKRDTTIIFLIFPRTNTSSSSSSERSHFSARFSPPVSAVLSGSVVQLLFPPHLVLFQLHQLWLLYYYFTLSLRENILYANGSSMKSWWITHHYISIVISLLLLLYPNQFIAARHTRLMLFGLVQGGVMTLQYLYQAKRGYVRKSLGKAKQIDVDATETIVEKPTDLWWLLPVLYALYLFELLLGLDVLSLWWQQRVELGGEEGDGCWHLLCIGCGCIVLAVGNAITTTLVIVSKQRLRRWRKLVRSRERSSSEAEHKLQQPPAGKPAGKAERDSEAKAQSTSEAANEEGEEGAGSRAGDDIKAKKESKAVRRKK